MKKIFVATMAAFALALTGCGSTGETSQTTEESHEAVVGQDCPAGMEQWQCDQFSEMAENAQEEQEEATKVVVPTPTEEPIDPDKAYNGDVDESDGFVTLNMAANMNYDDGLSVTLEQLEAIAGEGIGCLEVNDPCYVVIKMYIDNSESSDDYDPSVDTRSVPVIEYTNKSGEKVVAKSSDKYASGSSYADNTDGGKLGTVAAGDYDEFYLYYKLDDVKVVDGEAYRAHFEDDSEYPTVWVQEEGQDF